MVIILLKFEKKKIQLRVIHVGKNPDIGMHCIWSCKLGHRKCFLSGQINTNWNYEKNSTFKILHYCDLMQMFESQN